MDLSIIIPWNEQFMQKRQKRNIFNEEEVEENTMWSTAIYEVWHPEDVCFELFYDIKDLTQDLEEATRECDFSKEKAGEMEERKKKILEGVHILRSNEYTGLQSLGEDLSHLFCAAKAFVAKRHVINLLDNFKERLQDFGREISDFSSSYRFSFLGTRVKQDPAKINAFKKELVDIKEKFKFFQERLNKSEIKLTHSSITHLEFCIKDAEEWVNIV